MTQDEKDFFISYNKADRKWAEWIAFKLEEVGYTCIIQAWDFRPGSNFVLEMHKASSQAKRTLAVFSPDYLDALYTQPEWAAAFVQDPTGEKGLLIPIRVAECTLSGLLAPLIYIDLVNLQESEAKKALLAGVQGTRLKPSQSPKFPANIPDFPGSSNVRTNNNDPSGITLCATIQSSGDGFNRIAWSPDGRTFASASRDKVIQLWDTNTWKVKYTLPGKINYSIAWSPDGETLASGDRSSLFLWNTRTGTLRSTLNVTNTLHKSVAWSPDGRTLASGSDDHTIRLWNPATKQILCEFTEHSKSINSVAWSPDGRTLASGSDDHTTRLWNPVTEQLVETFLGHSGNVNSIAWSPNGQTIASGSDDCTIGIWDFEERQLLNTLTGHTKPIICIAFSHDGQLLASKSLDGTVRLWRSDTGEEVKKFDELANGWYAGLTFHPKESRLAALGEKDRIIRIWDLQIDTILNNSSASTVHYTSAKVILVGEKGVGKTSLGLVLAGQPYVPPESTHGRYIRPFHKQKVELADGLKEIREILLWDLAGQTHYRLIHQIYIKEAALALIIFNMHHGSDLFGGVNYWDRALKPTQSTLNNSNYSIKKFLVASHMDLGEKKGNSKYVQKIMEKLHFDAYFETSAKESIGIVELSEAIKSAINWDVLPKVTSFGLFQEIKDFIITLKEEGNEQLLTIDNLYQKFLNSQFHIINHNELKAQFETSITQLEAQDLVKKLQFGTFILLKPELLDYYASALIDTILSNEPEGLGSIAEEKVLEGDFDIPASQRLDKGLEKILLVEMVSYLLRHEIMLREYSDDGSHLVFPALATREPSDLIAKGVKTTTFRFEGPIHNIYTSLLVRLTYSNSFKKKDIGKNTATFTYSFDDSGDDDSGDDDPQRKLIICGIILQDINEGAGELTIFFSENASDEARVSFELYIYNHLKSHALARSIKKVPIFSCSNCGESVPELKVKHRLERGFTIIRCSICDAEVPLEEKDRRTFSASHLKISDIDLAADSQRDQEIGNTTFYGTSQAKIINEEFDVFLCYNPSDEANVKKIRQKLMFRGLAPLFNEEDLRPGFPWQTLLEQQIEKVKSAAVFIGKEGIGPWQKAEVNALLRQFVKRECPVIPVLLPNAPSEPELPLFLAGMTWVDFRRPLPTAYLSLESPPQDNLEELKAPSLELSKDYDHYDNRDPLQLDALNLYQNQDPMDFLVWGITGRRK